MPKIQISDVGFWKSVLQRFHAPQKNQNKVSAQMRPDDKRKSCAKKNNFVRAECCAEVIAQQKKVCCAATEKAAQNKSSARPAFERGCGKKQKSAWRPDKTRLLGCDKKNNFCAPCRPHTSPRKWQKKYFPCCAGDTAFAEATGHKKVTARAVKTEQTATGHKKAPRTALERGCDKKISAWRPDPLHAWLWPDNPK
jgi:hypothetical protein